MTKSLEEQFEAEQVKRLNAQSPWNSRRVHQKVLDEVGQALDALTRDGKIHLKKSNWGYIHHVAETSSHHEHFSVSLNLSGVSQENSLEPTKCTLRVPRGFKGLIARAQWIMMGEEAYIKRKAMVMMKMIAQIESEYCQKHNIAPMPAIEALAEAAQIKDVSKRPKASKPRSSSI